MLRLREKRIETELVNRFSVPFRLQRPFKRMFILGAAVQQPIGCIFSTKRIRHRRSDRTLNNWHRPAIRTNPRSWRVWDGAFSMHICHGQTFRFPVFGYHYYYFCFFHLSLNDFRTFFNLAIINDPHKLCIWNIFGKNVLTLLFVYCKRLCL